MSKEGRPGGLHAPGALSVLLLKELNIGPARARYKRIGQGTGGHRGLCPRGLALGGAAAPHEPPPRHAASLCEALPHPSHMPAPVPALVSLKLLVEGQGGQARGDGAETLVEEGRHAFRRVRHQGGCAFRDALAQAPRPA